MTTDSSHGGLSSFYPGLWKRWRESRRAERIARAGKGYEPLHGDRVLQSIVDEIIEGCSILTFVETGTFVGDTTKYVASGHPNLKVLTCEVNPRWYALAKRLCKGLDNIEFFLGESSLFLEQHRGTFESSRTLFWLDAHWGGSWPLFDETKVVSSVSSYALMVDDFEVPGRPMFHYDTYHGVKNCLQAHREFLGDNCLVPDYDPHSSCKNPAGYGLFFKNLDYSRLKTLGSLRKLQAQPISSGGGPP